MKEGDKHLRDLTKIYSASIPVSILFYLVQFTYRITRINFKPELSPVIYALWHGHQCGLVGIQPRKDLNILISQSNDGEIIAKVVESMGFSTIRGSQGRGGTEALREILRVLKNDKNVAYTPDGPKGPGFKAKEGVIQIAQMSSVPIVPVSFAAKWPFQFNTWDKYAFPMPFSEIVLTFGDPLYIPEKINEEEKEQYRLTLEKELLKLKDQAEKYFK